MGKGRKLLVFALAFWVALPVWGALATVKEQRISQNRLVLELDRPLKESEFKHFHLTLPGEFKRVVDFKGVYPDRAFETAADMPVGVRIAQFSPDTTRIVFFHDRAFNISVKSWQNRLVIDLEAPETPHKKTPEPAPKPQAPRERFGGYKPTVVIDPGHGGRDTGALSGRVREKEIVLNVGLETARILKERGFEVLMTRDRDVYVSLQDRTGLANRVKADLFVSIHANASPLSRTLQGLETYFLSPARSDRAKDVAALENSVVVENMGRYSQEAFLNFLNREMVVASNKLAIDLQRGMLSSVRTRFKEAQDNGVREGPFWVLVGAQMPAALVEIGYLTHPEEIRRLTSDAYQKTVAAGIAAGVESYFMNHLGSGF
ncbi:MAG: N-acetylmuramoyl-L-alanine amidase [Campylobacterales bacterium]